MGTLSEKQSESYKEEGFQGNLGSLVDKESTEEPTVPRSNPPFSKVFVANQTELATEEFQRNLGSLVNWDQHMHPRFAFQPTLVDVTTWMQAKGHTAWRILQNQTKTDLTFPWEGTLVLFVTFLLWFALLMTKL